MTEIVVVGGGLAGAAAAAALAHAGRRVLLLERETGPKDKLCGEFLSTEAQTHLAAIGLDLAPLGGAPIDRVRLVSGRREAESRLPFTALSLTRKRLDEALLEHAAAQGAKVERGVTVRSIAPGQVETSAGPLAAPTLLLASGKHDVRGARRDPAAGAIRGMVGFKSYFRLSPAQSAELAGFVEIVLFDGGYAGLQLVEDGAANLCLLVRQERFEATGRTWPGLLAALMAERHLARRLGDATELSARALSVSDVPFGYLTPVHDPTPGLFRLGDQAAVIPSFSGDGMSIALHSARLAAQAIGAGGSADAYHARLRRDVAGHVRLATWMQRALEVWPGRDAAAALLSLAPGTLGRLAAWTRVPAPAVARVG